MPSSGPNKLRVRALRIEQNTAHPLFMFSLLGADLMSISDISRVSRDDTGALIGYQRPEVRRHVSEIVDYLDGKNVIFPNALVLALSSAVRFKKSRGPKVGQSTVTPGTLEIPLPNGNQRKPAWIVDGQQRALAISKCHNPCLPIPVTAFVSDEVELQRDQFMRVNNTKPLPRGLISELLPEVSTDLPPRLAARRIPAAVCDLLNRNPDSPFYAMIRRPSTPDQQRKACVVADTSIIKMLQSSFSIPTGALFPYRNIATEETDFDGAFRLICVFWAAVKKAFPDAWGLPPTQSRLMHGAGIVAMGRLMDRIMAVVDPRQPDAVAAAYVEIKRISGICRWTSGHWDDLDGVAWDSLQNTPRDIRLLTNVLLRAYLEQRGKAA